MQTGFMAKVGVTAFGFAATFVTEVLVLVKPCFIRLLSRYLNRLPEYAPYLFHGHPNLDIQEALSGGFGSAHNDNQQAK
jgi:hypothetical protein